MSRLVTVTYATRATNASRPIAVTVPSPRPRPVFALGLENQSANDAPRGRVMMYATQNATIGFSCARHQPSAGIAMSAPNASADPKNPRSSCIAVQSPAARPEREGREHRHPVEALAAGGRDAVDGEGPLAAVPQREDRG